MKRTLGLKQKVNGKVIKTIPPSTKKLITSTVKKAVNASEETKRQNYQIIKTGGQSIALKDTSGGGLGAPGFETSGPLYANAQGADATQRIGRKIRPISLSYRMSVNLDVNVSNDRYLDIYLVKWNDYQPLAAGGVITPINDGQFLDADLVTSFFGTMCQRNIDYKSNFTVLKYKRYYLRPKQYQAATNSIHEITFNHRFPKNAYVKYQGPATTDITEGAYYFLYFTNSGDSNPAIATGIVLNGNIRMFYKDS